MAEASTIQPASIEPVQIGESETLAVAEVGKDEVPTVQPEESVMSTRLSESPVIVEYTDAVPEYELIGADGARAAPSDEEDMIVQSLLSPKPKSKPNTGRPSRRKRSETPEVYGSSALQTPSDRGRSRTRETPKNVKPTASGSDDDNVKEVVASPAVPPRSRKGKEVNRTPAKPASTSAKHKKRTSMSKTTVTLPVPGELDDHISSPVEELEVAALLTPGPSKPRYHRHGQHKSRRSSSIRRSNEPVIGSDAAPVHPEMDKHHSQHGFGRSQDSGSSPITTRSHCTYHKLSIPNSLLPSSGKADAANTPLRRMSTRLARATEPALPQYAENYIFLVPGCTVSDRLEQMKEEGMIDLGTASNQEEGSAMQLVEGDQLSVEGLPDAVLQSLIRVVGVDMFRCVVVLSSCLCGADRSVRIGRATVRFWHLY